MANCAYAMLYDGTIKLQTGNQLEDTLRAWNWKKALPNIQLNMTYKIFYNYFSRLWDVDKI